MRGGPSTGADTRRDGIRGIHIRTTDVVERRVLWLGRRHTRKVTECELRRAKVVGFSVPSTVY